jgi:hypothetical protein
MAFADPIRTEKWSWNTLADLLDDLHRDSIIDCGVATGTANALTLTTGLSLTSYTDGQTFKFRPSANNTGNVTINVDGIGGRTASVVQPAGGANEQLRPADLVVGAVYLGTYITATNHIVIQVESARSTQLSTNNQNLVSVISTTSTSLITTGVSATVDCGAGDNVLVVASFNISHGTTDGFGICRLLRGASNLGSEYFMREHLGHTNGATQCGAIAHIDTTPGLGSVTYNLHYRTSSGTVYMRARSITAYVFRST